MVLEKPKPSRNNIVDTLAGLLIFAGIFLSLVFGLSSLLPNPEYPNPLWAHVLGAFGPVLLLTSIPLMFINRHSQGEKKPKPSRNAPPTLGVKKQNQVGMSHLLQGKTWEQAKIIASIDRPFCLHCKAYERETGKKCTDSIA